MSFEIVLHSFACNPIFGRGVKYRCAQRAGSTRQSSSGWVVEGNRRVYVNFSFEDLEGKDEVSFEESVFQREEVELAKTSH